MSTSRRCGEATAESAPAVPPLVSVVIPTHNRRDMLAEALETVFAQTYRNIEVIVVDDGSTDGTRAMLEERYAGRVRVVERQQRSNGAVARNAGVAAATGKYLAFLDSDDWWLPGKLSAMVAVAESAGERVVLVGGACQHVDASGTRVLETVWPPEHASYQDFCVKLWLPGCMSNNLVRTSAFRRIGGFDESLVRAADKDLFIRLLDGFEVRYVREVTAKVRIHAEPRPGVNLEVAFDCRRRVDAKIADRAIRRRATAWTYFTFFERYWDLDRLRAFTLLLRSFTAYPFRVHPRLGRLRQTARRFLGG